MHSQNESHAVPTGERRPYVFGLEHFGSLEERAHQQVTNSTSNFESEGLSPISLHEEETSENDFGPDENRSLNLPFGEPTPARRAPRTSPTRVGRQVLWPVTAQPRMFTTTRRITTEDLSLCSDDQDEEDEEDNIESEEEDFSFEDRKKNVWQLHPDLLWTMLSRLPPQQDRDAGKLTVVLDLDETLIYAAHSRLKHPPSNPLPFTLQMKNECMTVYKRPCLEKFLKRASTKFELILFTAGTKDYARRIMDRLDPEGNMFRHFLSREHCTVEGKKYMKDLEIVNRDLKRTVLVDNNPHSFMSHQRGNGILIRSFDGTNFHDENDTQLVALYKVLKVLMVKDDVREALAGWNQDGPSMSGT